MTSSTITHATAVGYGALVNAGNRVWLGNPAVRQVWSAGSYNTSDLNFKTNITEEVPGLAFISLLRPVVYNFEAEKLAEFLTKNMPDSIRLKHLQRDFGPACSIRQSGFIAQEVEQAARKVGYNFNGLNIPKDENDTYGLSYPLFVVPLVKAIQEQQQMIGELRGALKSGDELFSALQTGLISQVSDPILLEKEGFGSPASAINFSLPENCASAHLIVYHPNGRQLKSLQLDTNSLSFTAQLFDELPAGDYLYSIIADEKMIVDAQALTLK
jgi:trimeric autotransporter adhesin